MPEESPKLKQRYRVHDPHDEKSARMIDATSPSDAAETFAEEDDEGQRAGLYTNSSWGHPLHVLDSNGDAFEVHVVVEPLPTAAAVKIGRVR